MSVIDLDGIKNSIKSILETANTTTGSPIDLSSSMVKRVNKILTLNPERIPIQPSFFPAITVFYQGKDVRVADMAVNLLNAKQRATIKAKILGIVWLDDINTANFQYADPADNECENLMENIEQVLRSDPTLQGKAMWARVTAAEYFNVNLGEDAHFRTGVIDFEIMVQY
jgi:hypothetical protein